MDDEFLKESSKLDLEQPKLFKITILNDDYTPFEFVIELLREIFNVEESEASRITQEIHNHGVSKFGLYTRDIAETKVYMANTVAQAEEYPLLCNMEPSDE